MSDTYGFKSKRTALFWHSRVDNSISWRMWALHHWALKNFCGGPYRTTCRRSHRTKVPVPTPTCANASFLICQVRRTAERDDNVTGCPGSAGLLASPEVDLLSELQYELSLSAASLAAAAAAEDAAPPRAATIGALDRAADEAAAEMGTGFAR